MCAFFIPQIPKNPQLFLPTCITQILNTMCKNTCYGIFFVLGFFCMIASIYGTVHFFILMENLHRLQDHGKKLDLYEFLFSVFLFASFCLLFVYTAACMSCMGLCDKSSKSAERERHQDAMDYVHILDD